MNKFQILFFAVLIFGTLSVGFIAIAVRLDVIIKLLRETKVKMVLGK
jgi:hypothetical protein